MNNSHAENSRVPGRPWVSFVLLAYQQESFIREAVAGALAQTYSPLEIIISDDGSPDRTFEIIQEMAAAYHGPHKIVLNHNPKSMGLCGHLNKVCALSQGDLIVAAAGDDVSLPERTLTLYEAWKIAGADVHSIFSNAITMDKEGNRLGNWLAKPWPVAKNLKEGIAGKDMAVLGCTHMFSRKTFEVFGPIPSGVLQEDNIIPFRSLLLGRVEYVPVPLVLYRRHGANLWQAAKDPLFKDLPRRKRWLRGEVALAESRLADLQKAVELGLVNASDGTALRAVIRRKLEEKRLELAFSETTPISRCFQGIRAVWLKRVSPVQTANLWVASFDSETMNRCWKNFKRLIPGRKKRKDGQSPA
jgi:glycosyltransferase involved in cell wall biosynthesis